MDAGKVLNDAELEELTRNTLHQLCVQPLETVAGSDILHAAISSE